MHCIFVQFLYSPFPVESCFDQRIDENVNAEITSGTIKTMLDCVGYLSWTFFARRVKVNPEYYGAESGSVEHVEAKLLSTSKESFGRLHDSGCIASLVPGDELSEIVPTYLGIAASQFYLSYRTPKQMQLGVKECRNIIMSNLQPEREFNEGDLSPENHPPTLAKFTRPIAVDEKSIAWLLFTLCSTHECDELPVRHNEELLNEELSAEVMWGPDTADLLAGTCKKGQQQYRNIEIFEDPHTKAFLLIQAHLEHVKLPISDYVNDTKSIVENIPRLLGAISYIAASETSAVGSFELLTQCCRTRQVFEAKCRVDQDPLLQLPGIDGDAIRRACGDRNKGLKSDLPSLYELRGIGRDSARSRLQKIAKNGVQSRKISLDNSVDAIYALPNVKLRSASIKTETNKSTGKETGKLSLTFEIERHSCRRSNDAKETNLSVTMTVLVGSFQQRFLLAKDAIRFSRFGNWTVEKELCFDWATAIADGGVDTGRIILRCVYEEIQGLDCEAILRLK